MFNCFKKKRHWQLIRFTFLLGEVGAPHLPQADTGVLGLQAPRSSEPGIL